MALGKAHRGVADGQPAEPSEAQRVRASASQTQWESAGAPTLFCCHRKIPSQLNMKDLTHYEIQLWQ